MARPKKSDQDRRTKLFQLRLLEDEYKAFVEAAKASGLDMSSWARTILLREARRYKSGGTK